MENQNNPDTKPSKEILVQTGASVYELNLRVSFYLLKTF